MNVIGKKFVARSEERSNGVRLGPRKASCFLGVRQINFKRPLNLPTVLNGCIHSAPPFKIWGPSDVVERVEIIWIWIDQQHAGDMIRYDSFKLCVSDKRQARIGRGHKEINKSSVLYCILPLFLLRLISYKKWCRICSIDGDTWAQS